LFGDNIADQLKNISEKKTSWAENELKQAQYGPEISTN
jgi:hypothetical protein